MVADATTNTCCILTYEYFIAVITALSRNLIHNNDSRWFTVKLLGDTEVNLRQLTLKRI